MIMRKLLMVVIAVFIGISGTASSVECPEDAVLVGLAQHDIPINEMDTQVVDGFLPVHGIIRDDVEISPAIPIANNKNVLMFETTEAGEIVNIIYE